MAHDPVLADTRPVLVASVTREEQGAGLTPPPRLNGGRDGKSISGGRASSGNDNRSHIHNNPARVLAMELADARVVRAAYAYILAGVGCGSAIVVPI